MHEFYNNNKVFIDKLLLLVSIAAFLALAVFLAGYITPFVAGYIISLILSPLVNIIHSKWRIHRGLTSAALILALLTALFFLGNFLVGLLLTEIAALAEDIGTYILAAQTLFENIAATIENVLGIELEQIDLSMLIPLVTGMLQGLEGGAFLAAIPLTIIRVIIAIVSAFFFMKDKELIAESIVGLFPKSFVARYRLVRQGLFKALIGYMKGQLIVMGLVSSVCIIGLIIIGSDYAFLIGIGIGIFDLIPVFGAGGILITWAVYHFIVGNFSFGIGLMIIYGVVFLTRQMLESHVIGEQIGIHPIILLMSVYVGVFAMGPVGILGGPLIALTIKTTMEADFTSNAATAAGNRKLLIYRKRKGKG
jgi:sporulation integral membrane protein YtvI